MFGLILEIRINSRHCFSQNILTFSKSSTLPLNFFSRFFPRGGIWDCLLGSRCGEEKMFSWIFMHNLGSFIGDFLFSLSPADVCAGCFDSLLFFSLISKQSWDYDGVELLVNWDICNKSAYQTSDECGGIVFRSFTDSAVKISLRCGKSNKRKLSKHASTQKEKNPRKTQFVFVFSADEKNLLFPPFFSFLI